MSASNTSTDKAEIQHVLDILHRWGIHTLGQLAELDKDELGRRLGPTAVHLWERANGKSIRLLKLVPPVESFAETFEFENEIETAEPLLFMLRRFLEQLSARLAAFYLVAKELTLKINFSDKKHYEHHFQIPQPTGNVEILFRMLQTHLENFTSESPIIAVSLEAHPAKPSGQQFGLFETALRNPAQLSETLARLIGLLGSDRVGTPVLDDTHRPDAFHLEPFSWELRRCAAAGRIASFFLCAATFSCAGFCFRFIGGKSTGAFTECGSARRGASSRRSISFFGRLVG